ncbi:nitroreductase family protein [Neisseria sp. Dent CA1/247]|uniref:nitroreductase family protein n=1 Tax=Neisseria sp. Dent CA1/247 TaxID=2912675 RepID=UPI001FD2E701|nr:nitroreductase family protein [Neisseria sp. Dent CA1/247]UOO78137.1 nitroreductase family protein [Neisseria sp. Dent CA1/247]
MKNAVETMLNHRTYRHFKNTPVPDADIQTIIDCAKQAPSWMNGQHYTIINITSPELRQKIVELQPANPQIGTCGVYLIFVADLHRADLCSRAAGGTYTAAGELDSLITAVTDTALAAQNAVVAAESLGYATCYTGGIRNIAVELVELLKLPKNTFPIVGLCIGEPDVEMKLKPRLPEQTVYAENAYPDDATLSDGLEQYEQTMTAFGEAREKFPYREKFARYYSNTYAPRNIKLMQQQGWLTKMNADSEPS